MRSHLRIRDQLDELARRLILEYRGALPPGQVLVTVRESNRILGRSIAPERRVAACEGIARRVLTERVGALAARDGLLRTA